MQSFDINIPANTQRNIDAQGDYLSYYQGSAGGADATLLLSHDSSGSTIQLKPGQAIRLQKGQSGGLWRLSNYANQATIIGTVVIGSGQVDDHTITGSVSVVDGEKARTLGGGMYSASPNSPAVAANYSLCQLWNPAGSGKNVIVSAVEIAGYAAVGVNIYTIAAMAATDQTALRAGNKLSGAAMGVAQARIDSAAGLPVFNNNLLQTIFVQASVSSVWNIKGAIVLKPGYGLSVIGATVNTQVLANFEWFEEPQ